MGNKSLVIIGDGQQSALTAEAAKLQNIDVHDCLSEKNEVSFFESPNINKEHHFIIAIGNNQTRAEIAQRLEKHNLNYINIIHPEAFISPSAQLGTGNFVGPKAVIHTNAKIGHHCIINTSSVVEHDCLISDYVHIAPGAIVTGDVTIGEAAMIGAGAVILPKTEIRASDLAKAGTVHKNSS